MKARKFLQTTLLGGLVAILPLGLLIIVFRWIIILVEKYLKPLVNLFQHDSKISTIITYLIAIVGILLIFFFVGLFIQTRIGIWVRNYLEKSYLMKIPGYKTARDIVGQFFGNKRTFFSHVVLVDVYSNETLMTGFVTDDCGNYVTVFVPTAPNPTSGFIFHVPKSKVFKSNVPVDVAIKSIISCGSGSAPVFANKMDEPFSTNMPGSEKEDSSMNN
jgi:uncharacterized membrane protein